MNSVTELKTVPEAELSEMDWFAAVSTTFLWVTATLLLIVGAVEFNLFGIFVSFFTSPTITDGIVTISSMAVYVLLSVLLVLSYRNIAKGGSSRKGAF